MVVCAQCLKALFIYINSTIPRSTTQNVVEMWPGSVRWHVPTRQAKDSLVTRRKAA